METNKELLQKPKLEYSERLRSKYYYLRGQADRGLLNEIDFELLQKLHYQIMIPYWETKK